MTPVCAPPDTAVGVSLRLSSYLDCQARSLGEHGFQAIAGGAAGTSLLSGAVTIFIALIGYRLILGRTVELSDGVGWAVRLGVVLALVTSWPAFQTLVFRVALDAPGELASTLLPASGLPSEGLAARVQQAYDTMRLGVMEQSAAQPSLTGVAPSPSAPQSAVQFEAPLPNTASLLVISTIGLIGALKVATGFLLAVAPLAFFSLLFEGTIGLFNGWVRAICGLALAVVGANVVTAIDLVLVESELAHVQQSRIPGFSSVFDPQALTTIVALFFLAALVSMFAAMRMGSALGLTFTRSLSPKRHSAANGMHFASEHTAARSQSAEPGSTAEPAQFGRAAIIAGSLKKSVEREKTGPFVSAAAAKHGSREIDGAVNGRVRQPLQPRRGHARRTRIAARRDGRV